MRDRRFALVVLVVALALAGGLSLFASSAPDGLERVGADTGFGPTATDSAASGSPLAGYETSFLHGAVGQAVAGIVGVLVTLAVFYGLTRLLRRRQPTR